MRAWSCWRRDLRQGAVGRVLDQGMLEGVGRVGRRAVTEHELGRDQLVQGGLQLRLGRSATAASSAWENSRPMAAPICATSLTRASRSRRASSESCSVAGIASGGRGRELVVVAGVAKQAGLEHRLGQLLDEQRHAVGLGHDLLQRPRPAGPVAPTTRGHHGRALSRRLSRLSGSVLTCGCAGHGGVNSGRKVMTSSTGRRCDPLDQQVQQLQRGRIDPVHVLIPRAPAARAARPRAAPAAPRASLASGAAASGRAAGSARRSEPEQRRDQRHTWSSLSVPRASRASSLSSLASGGSSRSKPAARSRCSITG